MSSKKTLVFSPKAEIFEKLEVQPVPATKKVPEWYKKMPKFVDQSKEKIRLNNMPNTTAKWCMPLLDAITAGYMIVLPCDIFVDTDPTQFRIQWDVEGFIPIMQHHTSHYPGMPTPDGYEEHAFKFEGSHLIKAPAGYSLLFTHPLNRFDLPFYTLSGIVDSDTFDFMPINLPFFLKKGFEGVIEKGTPIAQVIPIKREDWGHLVEKHETDKRQLRWDILKSTIIRSYKSRFWKRKSYT